MVRKKRRSKKKSSNKLLKTAILLILFIGLLFIYNHTDIPARIQNALRPHKPTTVQTVPEPEVTPPTQQTGGLPPPEPVVPPPSTKNVTYTIKNPQFDNLSYGGPGKADSIVEREGYALGYIEKHEQPAWVQYIMTADEVSRRAAKRGDDFRPDPDVPTGSATPQDYTRSGYDRGHLAPAADMSFSVKTMSESFFMSNMSPQAPQFNRGIWSKLEKQVRHFATKEKRIVVVTGPILPAEKTITIGANKVTVPQYYYKVIYDTTLPEKMIGFVLPNKGSNADLRTFVVTVDRVEPFLRIFTLGRCLSIRSLRSLVKFVRFHLLETFFSLQLHFIARLCCLKTEELFLRGLFLCIASDIPKTAGGRRISG